MAGKKYSTIFFDWGGVIANDPDEFLDQLVRRLGATDEQIYHIALDHFGVTAKESVFINDPRAVMEA